MDEPMKRRSFVKGLVGAAGAAAVATEAFGVPVRYLKPTQVDNPLAVYPDRDWEKSYRDLFKPDSTFTFLCAPNDTHNCLLKAHVKNGVVVRCGPTFGYGKAEDLYGNKATSRWDPRICNKGLALPRRIYGDRRVKAPMIRKGFKEWADAGFPRDPATGKPDAKYFQRGKDQWLRASWEDAWEISAKAMQNIAQTYSGEEGAARLKAQGYDADMIASMGGAGTQTIKLRGGMALLGVTRIFALIRLANQMALLDDKVRGVGPDKAKGARGLDSYSWHTDLPPGHPMVIGSQTNDFDLFATEYANLVLVWGMNWITTKMPDSHWLTEARLKGTRIASVTVEYSATASKSDEAYIIRPGTDPAFALGLAQVMIKNRTFDAQFVARNTDLPFLVRMDTLQPLRPAEVIAGYQAPELKSLKILKNGEKAPANFQQREQVVPEAMAGDFQPAVVWDTKTKKPVAVTRDDFGAAFDKTGISPDLGAKQKLKLLDGTTVEVRTVFSLTEEYLNNNCTPKQTEMVTGCPAKAVEKLAADIAKNKEKTLFAVGMGPNQFFNADLKDRAIFLVAALSRNIGFPGGNVGSYAGNYKVSVFNGEPSFILEDPFNPQLDPAGKPAVKKYLGYDSLHFLNYGDRPLKVGKTNFTGKSHMPAPTKVFWNSNSNSSLGNTKWHYDFVFNSLPKYEMVAYSEWWWTASCEYSDIVFAVDSWAEFKEPDMTASCTNPFLTIYPRTDLPRLFDTRSDLQVVAGVAKALGRLTGESRFEDGWKFVHDGKPEVYLQRIIDASSTARGYKFEDLEAKAKQGIPSLMHTRTYPRATSYEQVHDGQPWHTKSGRLEFYRFESEFIDAGENLVVHREPIDATHYEPAVIVARKHPALRPKQPADHGIDPKDLSVETRQVRNVMKTPEELVKSKHPLKLQMYTHVYHTPKYRHGTHTTPVDTDANGVWFGPFGDMYRHDKRMASVVEGYVDINPTDAKELGIDDGDYVWIDADPEDRPYRGWKKGTDEYKTARLMLRARYYPGTPRGIARTWHNMYGATLGSVKGHEQRQDGLAKSEGTNYQSMYRYGSHQSATRAWLKPTLMTDSLVHKTNFGQQIAKGFEADVHCPVGAPRESFVKITKAEPGGMAGKGRWRPVEMGVRPTYENERMKQYLAGSFVQAPAKKKGE